MAGEDPAEPFGHPEQRTQGSGDDEGGSQERSGEHGESDQGARGGDDDGDLDVAMPCGAGQVVLERRVPPGLPVGDPGEYPTEALGDRLAGRSTK